MGKTLADAVFDGASAIIAACTRIDVTSDTSTPANLTNTLANTAMTAGLGNGDYTAADGDSSGRKVTTTQKSAVSVTASGDAKHIVLSVGGVIKLTTTCTTQTLTSGNTVTIPAFKCEFADPT
jgi:Flp pilus assembly protein TadG